MSRHAVPPAVLSSRSAGAAFAPAFPGPDAPRARVGGQGRDSRKCAAVPDRMGRFRTKGRDGPAWNQSFRPLAAAILPALSPPATVDTGTSVRNTPIASAVAAPDCRRDSSCISALTSMRVLRALAQLIPSYMPAGIGAGAIASGRLAQAETDRTRAADNAVPKHPIFKTDPRAKGNKSRELDHGSRPDRRTVLDRGSDFLPLSAKRRGPRFRAEAKPGLRRPAPKAHPRSWARRWPAWPAGRSQARCPRRAA